MDDLEFIAAVTYRLEQRPQGVRFPAEAIFSVKDACLQRLADRTAADPVSYTILQQAFPFVLSSGEISVEGQTPTLLLSKEARENWHVTMTGVRFPLIHIPNRRDFSTLPPTPDYYFYNILAGVLAVRTYDNQIPAETALQLYGNYVPLISDSSLGTSGELKDDLLDIAIALLLETQAPQEAKRQAEAVKTPSASA